MRFFMIIMTTFVLAACQDSKFKGYTGSDRAEDRPNDNQTPASPGGGTNNSVPGGNGTSTPGNGIGIEFGSLTHFWHLGNAKIFNANGQMSDSSCKVRMMLSSGKPQVDFTFLIGQDNTQLGLAVKHCGVGGTGQSYSFQNKASLYGPNGQFIESIVLTETDNQFFKTGQKFPQTLTLNAGWYTIRVASDLNPAEGDLDDFVVGGVQFLAPTGPVTLGKAEYTQ